MLEQRQKTLWIMNTRGHCGTVLIGLFKHTRFCGSCLWCCIFKRGRVAMGAHLPPIYLFLKFNRNIVGIIFAVLISLLVLTNTCDAPFSAASSSFIIIMVRVHSCRILFKLTFLKPFIFLTWWYLMSSQSELSEAAPFLSRWFYEMA